MASRFSIVSCSINYSSNIIVKGNEECKERIFKAKIEILDTVTSKRIQLSWPSEGLSVKEGSWSHNQVLKVVGDKLGVDLRFVSGIERTELSNEGCLSKVSGYLVVKTKVTGERGGDEYLEQEFEMISSEAPQALEAFVQLIVDAVNQTLKMSPVFVQPVPASDAMDVTTLSPAELCALAGV